MDTIKVDEVTDKKLVDQPQCQYFVARKKRLCRMTVRAGRNYCGEHEPQPTTEKGNDDKRVPCPYDPKHTCYASKLSKHLAICNARQMEVPSYIVHNINAPPAPPASPRTLLSQVPQQKILALIDKVNILYDKYVKDTITTMDERPIHEAVMAEFSEEGRAESSLRHLRQVSSLLHAAEAEGLVKDGTCYVELGAGKGHLSYYAYSAWCGAGSSRVLLVDRASLRHKRDNKLRPAAGAGESGDGEGGDGRVRRVRADLADLALHKVPEVASCAGVVGLAKHLCGAATDYALRCVTGVGGEGGEGRAARGLVLATCCHHRCEPASYVGAPHLQEMGITEEELSIMLGVVSWATCGDGRSRERRALGPKRLRRDDDGPKASVEERAAAGRRAKALLDEGRARYLRDAGYRVRLTHYVPAHVSLENVAIVATYDNQHTNDTHCYES